MKIKNRRSNEALPHKEKGTPVLGFFIAGGSLAFLWVIAYLKGRAE